MKKKCIIVDGPDCTGKTTLCEKLSDMYNIPIYHLTYYEDPERHSAQFEQASEMMLEWIRNGHEGGFILDRYIQSFFFNCANIVSFTFIFTMCIKNSAKSTQYAITKVVSCIAKKFKLKRINRKFFMIAFNRKLARMFLHPVI